MIDQPKGDKPALTVVIQSWWTPALAVLMLVVGLLAGYFGRPLLSKGAVPTAEIAAVDTPSANLTTNQNPAVTTSVDPTMAAISSQQQLMDYLVSHTTHFLGDATAKVTIIEFSDYQ
jgi:hypothetical protein